MRFCPLCILSTLILVACASTEPGAGPGSENPVAPPEPAGRSPLAAILQAEFDGVCTEADLQKWMRGSAGERERLALALGRGMTVSGSAGTQGTPRRQALGKLWSDEDPNVRAAAAFSLGQLGDAWIGEEVPALREESDPTVRARNIEATGKLSSTEARSAMFMLMEIEQRLSLSELIELVSATHRWDVLEPTANGVDARLVDMLNRRAPDVQRMRAMERSPEIEIARRILFALQRRNAARTRLLAEHEHTTTAEDLEDGRELALELFTRWSESEDALAQIFAVRGLRFVPSNASTRTALRKASNSDDWRVTCEATLGMATTSDARSLQSLLEIAREESPHVRRTAVEALGAFASFADDLRECWSVSLQDASASVRAATLVASTRVQGDALVAELRVAAEDPSAVVRAGAAGATAHLAPEHALPLIKKLAQDEHLMVAGAALMSLGKHDTTEARELLYEHLQHEDHGLRLMAVMALAETPRERDVPHMIRVYDATQGGALSSEVRFNAVRLAATFRTPEVAVFLGRVESTDPDRYVRSLVAEHWDWMLEAAHLQASAEVPPNRKRIELPQALVELASSDTPLFVRITTSRGTMLFELFPRETPFHVYNFLTLAESAHYDGLEFHRVVPDFVIQGGDVRGDGNGGTTWCGRPLPAEFTPRKYVRGSLGMPRNEDPNSGGSQIFVTHRATPHLDGRYTIFGELREGFEVLDLIEVGDRILDVERVPR